MEEPSKPRPSVKAPSTSAGARATDFQGADDVGEPQPHKAHIALLNGSQHVFLLTVHSVSGSSLGLWGLDRVSTLPNAMDTRADTTAGTTPIAARSRLELCAQLRLMVQTPAAPGRTPLRRTAQSRPAQSRLLPTAGPANEQATALTPKRIRTVHLQRFKDEGQKFSMLTAYDAMMAEVLDDAGVEVLLIGDSPPM